MNLITTWQTSLPLLISQYWVEARDAERSVYQLYQRHYTYNANSKSFAFSGVGEKTVLTTPAHDAGFVWLKQSIRDDGQTGVCCTLFRNESSVISSDLIIDACEIAYRRWGDDIRLFTFVNPRKIRSSNPGYCFKVAGFVACGLTKVNKLVILERVR